MLNLKLHYIKQILVLKILCHQHRHSYTDTVSLPFTVIQKVNLITLFILVKPIATFSGYLLTGLIEVAYVLVVVATRSKFTCYLSCSQKLVSTSRVCSSKRTQPSLYFISTRLGHISEIGSDEKSHDVFDCRLRQGHIDWYHETCI